VRESVVKQNSQDAGGNVALLHHQCETLRSKDCDCAVTVSSWENANIGRCFIHSFMKLRYPNSLNVEE
jgi:hypothetical protein